MNRLLGARLFLVLALMLGLCSMAPGPVTASDGPFTGVTASPYGKFKGVEYVRYVGQFEGMAPGGPYSVLFEVVAPQDPARSNGTLIVEPYHLGDYPGGREFFLSPQYLFENGFMHAALRWYLGDVMPFSPLGGMTPAQVADAAAIISSFVGAIQTEPQGLAMVGTVERVYATGISFTSYAIHEVLHTPQGEGLFDLSLLVTPRWYRETHEQPENTGKVIIVQTEAETVADALFGLHSAATHGESDTYRFYEFAGAAHIPNNALSRALYGEPNVGTNTLDWTLAMRAVLAAGHAWVMEGVAPPPSTLIAAAPAGEIDPVYGVETGIARDALGNALGGVRMPDLAIGRGQYIASDMSIYWMGGLVGALIDMRCEVFRNHGAYVSQFAQAADSLVSQRFLLPRDAAMLKIEAAQIAKCP